MPSVRWRNAERLFEKMLLAVDVDASTTSESLFLHPKPVEDDALFAASVRRHLATDENAHVVSYGDPRHGFVLPVRSGTPAEATEAAFYVEIHSRLTAWWLAYAWRADELRRVTAELAARRQILAAASCARALLETAAAFCDDAENVQSVWDKIKRTPTFGSAGKLVTNRSELTNLLLSLQLGAKFKETQLPAFDGKDRAHVMGGLKRLARARPDDDVWSSYEWLCNAVHPSVGTTLVRGANVQTHASQFFSRMMIAHSPPDEQPMGSSGVGLISDAIELASATALEVLAVAMPATLVVIDDVGLTSGACAVADFHYWRRITPSERNEMCVCGSGKKTKRCGHDWGQPSPALPGR